MRRSGVCIAVLALALMCGCGGKSPSPEPAAQPSAEPAAKPAPAPADETAARPKMETPQPPKHFDSGLILNGGFERWYDDVAVPVFWEAGKGYPAGEAPVSLERAEDGPDGRGTHVKQQWNRSDSLEAIERTFSTEVSGLKPDTPYRLDLDASNRTRNTINVFAWQIGKNGEKTRLHPSVITVAPNEGWQSYAGSFRTGAGEAAGVTVRIGVITASGDQFPATVYWDNFRLTEIIQ